MGSPQGAPTFLSPVGPLPTQPCVLHPVFSMPLAWALLSSCDLSSHQRLSFPFCPVCSHTTFREFTHTLTPTHIPGMPICNMLTSHMHTRSRQHSHKHTLTHALTWTQDALENFPDHEAPLPPASLLLLPWQGASPWPWLCPSLPSFLAPGTRHASRANFSPLLALVDSPTCHRPLPRLLFGAPHPAKPGHPLPSAAGREGTPGRGGRRQVDGQTEGQPEPWAGAPREEGGACT